MTSFRSSRLAPSALLVGAAVGAVSVSCSRKDSGAPDVGRPASKLAAPGAPGPSNPRSVGASSPGAVATAPAAPVPDRVAAIAAGSNNTFAVYASGKVKAWGANAYASLGLGKQQPIVSPTAVPDLAELQQISTTAWHSCAVLRGGVAKCWGRNFGGALGDGNPKDYTASAPSPVVDVKDIQEVRVAQNHSCARDTAGIGYCWGMIVHGINDHPKPVAKLGKIVALALGGDSSCAWDSEGSATCWDLAIGLTFNYGDAIDVGDGNLKPAARVKGLSGVTRLAVSEKHACAVSRDGKLYCWGSGSAGQLGDGRSGGETYMMGTTPVEGYTVFKLQPVPELVGVRAVALGSRFTCATLESGQVQCWGANEWGQLGVGDKKRRTRPAPVEGLTGVTELAAGEAHVCALTAAGEVYCWGRGVQGQLGDGRSGVRAGSLRPMRVELVL